MPPDASAIQIPTQSPGKALPRSLLIVWILAVLIGVGLALTRIPSVFVGGEVHPLGNDGFYHAARILAIAEDPTSTHAFDPNLHWPEGLWVTWPWAYDYLGGVVTGLLSSDRWSAAKVMVFYPLLWLIANITISGTSLAEYFVNFLNPVGILLGLNGIILLAYIVAIPANEIVKHYAKNKGTDKSQFEFVYFLDAVEKEGRTFVSTENALLDSHKRVKWSFAME